MKRILVTGGSGLLGPFLIAEARSIGHVYSLSRSRGTYLCDLTETGQLKDVLADAKPDIILHAAALTDVDLCEESPDVAYNINVSATMNVSKLAKPKCKLIYFSTDQIYPNAQGPHSENTSGPVNTYGRTKLIGEKAVLERPNSLVIRTNFLCTSQSEGRSGLLDFFISALTEDREIQTFRDVFFSPLGARSLAKIALELTALNASGIYNVGSREGQTKAEVFDEVVSILGVTNPQVRAIDSTSISTRAPRSLDLRMDVSKVEAKLGREMNTLKAELREILSA